MKRAGRKTCMRSPAWRTCCHWSRRTPRGWRLAPRAWAAPDARELTGSGSGTDYARLVPRRRAAALGTPPPEEEKGERPGNILARQTLDEAGAERGGEGQWRPRSI